MSFLKAYSKFLDIIQQIVRVLLIILMAGMAVIMFYQAVMRYLFNDPQAWCEELAVYMSVYCVMLGICLATRRESHLQVDFLMSFCSERFKRLVGIATSVVGIIVMALFAYFSFNLMAVAIGKSTTLPLTMRDIYLVFPVGCALLILYSIEGIVKNFIAFKNGGEFPELEGGAK